MSTIIANDMQEQVAELRKAGYLYPEYPELQCSHEKKPPYQTIRGDLFTCRKCKIYWIVKPEIK